MVQVYCILSVTCIYFSGILQGTTSLLLVLDESEVRRIVSHCRNVQEYLTVTEVLETANDLIAFLKVTH